MTTPESDRPVEDSGAGESPTTPPGRGRFRRSGWFKDLAAVASFGLLACWVTARMWWNPEHGIRDNKTDMAQFEWMMAHGARVVTEFAYPFTSDRMNVPESVNLVANTSVLSVSLPMTPITLVFGTRSAFLVFLTLGMIATATSWYFLLSRVVVGSRGPAWLGATFCAYAPAMVSHANAHPNIVAQYVVPLIIWRTLRLADPGRWLRNGLLLALVIVWQAFLNLEILLMTAIGVGVVIVALALGRPELRGRTRTFLAGLGVAAGVSAVLLAYPLYVQFFGPGAYHGLSWVIRGYSTDLASFVAYARESVAGDARSATGLAKNPTEENSFFGWPLVIGVVALVWWLRRNIVVLALAGLGVLFAVFSLGREIRFDREGTGIPAPWALLEDLPVLHSVVPTRWALAITPIIGVLLAYGAARAHELATRYPARRSQIRFATVTVLAMALVPVLPTPLPTKRLEPTPEFVTSGAWRPYLAGGRSLVTLPLPDTEYADPLRWSAQTRLEMPIARGYFLGPDTRPGKDRIALFGAPPRPTSSFFATVRRSGEVPPVTAQDRREAIEDLRYWRAGAVVLAPQPSAEALRQAMTDLTGIEPVQTGGVWLWDVRPLTG
ncbi:hypothetical protein ACGFIK_11190 [Micromonospora sp. NPDC048871]|uniref:hypothetical protein n=1 Tax=Micromonospora sp. NPDC048871 TaxID=3364259 RepID=UPI0037214F72